MLSCRGDRGSRNRSCSVDSVPTGQEQTVSTQLHELGKVGKDHTEKLDRISECLIFVADAIKKISSDNFNDVVDDGAVEKQCEFDFDRHLQARIQPVLSKIEDLGALITRTNVRNDLRPQTAEAQALRDTAFASSAQVEGFHSKLREDFEILRQAVSQTRVETSSFQIQMRSDLAEIQQIVRKELHEKLDEHLPTSKFLAKLVSTPRSEETASIVTPLLDESMSLPQERKYSPRAAPQPPPVREPEPPDERPDALTVAASILDADGALATNKLLMRASDDHDIVDDVQLKTNRALATVFMRDDQVTQLPFNTVDYYKTSGWAQGVARTDSFDRMTNFMIVLNAIYLGIETDLNSKTNLYEAHWTFQAFTQFFTIYFTLELLIRFLAVEESKQCLRDGWFKFDLLLVTSMIIDVYVIQPIVFVTEGSHSRIHIEPIRLFRLVKLMRMARLVEVFPELALMIKALVTSLRAIASTMLLVFTMLYACGIFLHMMLRDYGDLNQQLNRQYELSFDSLLDCFWTLLVAGVLQLDNSALIMTTLIYGDSFSLKLAGFTFTLFSLISSLLIIQMLIGVLCDVIARIGLEQRCNEAIALVRQEVLGDLLELDAGGGTISQIGLGQVLNSPNSKALLKKLKVNRLFFSELANMLFLEPGHNVSIKVIMELLILCRGDSATNVDILASAFCFLTNELVAMENRIRFDISHTKGKNSEERISTRRAKAAKLLGDPSGTPYEMCV